MFSNFTGPFGLLILYTKLELCSKKTQKVKNVQQWKCKDLSWFNLLTSPSVDVNCKFATVADYLK